MLTWSRILNVKSLIVTSIDRNAMFKARRTHIKAMIFAYFFGASWTSLISFRSYRDYSQELARLLDIREF